MKTASLLALLAGCARDVTAVRDASPTEATAAARTAAPPSLPSPPPAAPDRRDEIRYLALGDSFTIGTGSSPDQAFPARLADRFRAAGRAVALRNVAVNGFTTQDLLDVEIPEVARFSPTFVTLAVGANDLVRGSDVDRYRAQLRRIFTAVTAAGVPAASIAVIPQPDWSLAPVAADFGDPRAIARQIEAFNAALRDEAIAAGARYVDVFPRMREEARRGAFARDGLHPSAAAHDAWAAEIAARLQP